jgi:hypothetical protein
MVTCWEILCPVLRPGATLSEQSWRVKALDCRPVRSPNSTLHSRTSLTGPSACPVVGFEQEACYGRSELSGNEQFP